MLTDPNPKTQTSSQSRVNRLLGVRILGTGLCVPDNAVLNSDLTKLGCDADWIIQRTGIQSRFHILPGQATSDLAIGAAKDCLERTGVSPDEIDMILVATMTADHYTPSSACLVQPALGCQCGALDVNAACSGFMYALVLGSQLVKSGGYRNVMVIGAETMTMVVDPNDKKTYPLFGDGAAASIVTSAEPADSGVDDTNNSQPGFLAYRLASVGELGDKLVVPAGGSRYPICQQVVDDRSQFLEMEGRSVFKWAVRLIPDVVNELCAAAGVSLDDIDLIIPHQANRRIIDAASESLEISPEKIFMNVHRYGNTSAASIPICIHEALQAGRIRSGDRVLLIGFGAGLTWGGCLLHWG